MMKELLIVAAVLAATYGKPYDGPRPGRKHG